MTSDEKRAGMMYIGDDGRTVYALNNRGDRVDVGEVAEHAASGCVVTLRGSIKSVVGTVRQVPRVETIADAEALFGRGAEVIGARGGVAECLAADAPPVVAVAVGASTPQPDGTHLVNVRLDAPPSALWRRCPECKGRSFVVRHRPDQGSASIRACPVCRGSGEVACPAERKLAVADVTLPPVDLAAENAALREALAASGELLAEAHAELERLRGER